MEKKKSFFIQKLDSGFVLEEDQKTKSAYEGKVRLEETICNFVRMEMGRLDHVHAKDLLISITTETNIPSVKND